jgi:hypothetical protein
VCLSAGSCEVLSAYDKRREGAKELGCNGARKRTGRKVEGNGRSGEERRGACELVCSAEIKKEGRKEGRERRRINQRTQSRRRKGRRRRAEKRKPGVKGGR